MKVFYLLLIFLVGSFSSFSQTTTIITDSTATDTILVIKSEPDTTTIPEPPQLLPQHYLLTQRLLWSEYGLIRQIPGMQLNEQNRAREVKWRTYMLKAHRLLGYATIIGMAGQAITGAKMYKMDKYDADGEENNQYDKWKGIHEGFAAYTIATYFTSGGMMLLAPPWKTDRAAGYSNTKLHKYLSFLHMGCMIASIASAGGAEHPGFVRDFHRATAFTAFGTYFISTFIIHF